MSDSAKIHTYFTSNRIDTLNQQLCNNPNKINKLESDERFYRLAQWICAGASAVVLTSSTAGFLFAASPLIVGIGVLGGIALGVYALYLGTLKDDIEILKQAFTYLLKGEYSKAYPFLKSMVSPEGILKPFFENLYEKILSTEEIRVVSANKRVLYFENAIGTILIQATYNHILSSTNSEDLKTWREDLKIAENLCKFKIPEEERLLIDLVNKNSWSAIKNPPTPSQPKQTILPKQNSSVPPKKTPANYTVPNPSPVQKPQSIPHIKERYKVNPDHIQRSYLTRAAILRKTEAFEKSNLNVLLEERKKSKEYGQLSEAHKGAFHQFIQNVNLQKIPRDSEVFSNPREKEMSYKTLSNTCKAILTLLPNHPLEIWEKVAALFSAAVAECPIAYADAAFQAYLLVSNQTELEEKTNSMPNKLLIMLNELRANIVRHMAVKKGRKETHTNISILKHIGKDKNISDLDLIQVSDKQDDLKNASSVELSTEFDRDYNLETIVDWVYTGVNGLPSFQKPRIPRTEVIDDLISTKKSPEREDQMAKLYGASSSKDLCDDAGNYQFLTVDAIAQLLAKNDIFIDLKSNQKVPIKPIEPIRSIPRPAYTNDTFLDLETKVADRPAESYIVLSDGYAYDLNPSSVDARFLYKTFKKKNPESPWTRKRFTPDDYAKFLSCLSEEGIKQLETSTAPEVPTEDSTYMLEEEASELLLRFAGLLCQEMDNFRRSETALITIFEVYTAQNAIFRRQLQSNEASRFQFRTIEQLIQGLQKGENAHIVGVLLWKTIAHHFPHKTIGIPVPTDLANAARYHKISLS